VIRQPRRPAVENRQKAGIQLKKWGEDEKAALIQILCVYRPITLHNSNHQTYIMAPRLLLFFLVGLSTQIPSLRCHLSDQIDQAVHTITGLPNTSSLHTSPNFHQSHITLELSGKGAHRHLHYDLRLVSRSHSITTPTRFTIIQYLPAAIFADIYELDNNASVQQGPPVILIGRLDLESTEQYTTPTTLIIHLPPPPSLPQTSTITISTTIPLHARYPIPQQHTTTTNDRGLPWWSSVPVNITIPPPSLLLVNYPNDDDGDDDDTWTSIDLDTTNSNGLVWTIPAGNIAHAKMVTTVTAVSIILGAVVVLSAFISNTTKERKRGVRRSTGTKVD